MQKQITNGRSTSPASNEKWAVKVDKETFFINKQQLQALKEMMVGGNRGMAWFGDFAVSIPHIQCIHLVERRLKNTSGVHEAIFAANNLGSKERERMLKKMAEVRKDLSARNIIK